MEKYRRLRYFLISFMKMLYTNQLVDNKKILFVEVGKYFETIQKGELFYVDMCMCKLQSLLQSSKWTSLYSSDAYKLCLYGNRQIVDKWISIISRKRIFLYILFIQLHISAYSTWKSTIYSDTWENLLIVNPLLF